MTPGALTRGLAVAVFGGGLAVSLATSNSTAVIAAAGAAFVLLVLLDSALLLVLAPAASFASWRVGPSSFDMSLTDVSLLLALAGGIRYVPVGSVRLRRLLLSLFLYQALLVVVVAASPTERAVFEWLHRISLVGGAAMIGAAIAHRGHIPRALRAFNAAALVVSSAAIVNTLTQGFGPAYPFSIQKNPAGTIIGVAIVLAVMVPDVAVSAPRWRVATLVVLVSGLLATQSRGAILASLAAIALWTVRRRGVRRSALVTLAMVSAMAAVVFLVNIRESDSVREDANRARFTAAATREENVGQALDRWEAAPIAGAGLRYFIELEDQEPHNVVASNLAEGGLVGLLALGILVAGALSALRSATGPLATAARFALLYQFVAATFDIYWRAGTGSLPWLLVGMALIDASPASSGRSSSIFSARGPRLDSVRH